jgi:YD repeat-containing protein
MSSERKAQGKRRPMIDRHRRRMIAAFKCNDCGLNVIRAGEYYMVSPQIWDDRLHLEWNDSLCIGCLESRLGRKLTTLDFIAVPQNPGGFSLSERYHRRLVGDQQYERDIAKLRSRAKRMLAASKACAAVAIVLLLMPTGAHAQQREFYDTRTGKSIGRATPDSSGSVTIYDPAGRVTGRTSTDSAGTTTFYDASGRNVGSVTTPQKREKP